MTPSDQRMRSIRLPTAPPASTPTAVEPSPSAPLTERQAGAQFGRAVQVDGSYVVVGAPFGGHAQTTPIRLEAAGENRVRVHSVAGRPATQFLKVSAAYADGWKATSTLVYGWPDAASKARAAADILRQRLDALGCRFDEYRAELVGLNALTEGALPGRPEGDLDEVDVLCAPVLAGPTLARSVLTGLPDKLRAEQSVFDTTGGLHAAGCFGVVRTSHVSAPIRSGPAVLTKR